MTTPLSDALADPHPVLQGVVMGVLGTIPIGRLRGGARLAAVLTPGVAAGALIHQGVVRSSPESQLRRWGIVLSTGVGVVTAGTVWLSILGDAAAESFLRRHGVPQPRLALGAVSGVAGTVLAYCERTAQPRSDEAASQQRGS